MATMSTQPVERLGIVLSTVTDAPPQEFVEIGQLAEAHGFESIYVNEGRGDAIACAQAIALGTKQIVTGTNIANIFFRHPFLAASSSRTVAELSEGRFILGLGMSHRAMLASLNIDMGDARKALGDYTIAVRDALRGNAGSGFLKQTASRYPVPVYVAGNTVESAKLAGACGDGIMPFLSPLSSLRTLNDAALEARIEHARETEPFGCILSIPTFISDDEEQARSAARYNLAFFAALPNYRRQWRRAGFKTAMDAVQRILQSGSRSEAAQQIPDELVESVCVFGNPSQCNAQLQAFRDVGVDVPVIAVSPVNEDRLVATRKAIVALAPN
jgi:alkanesulfonate monooxygenase SsuD/methylene tetrahydromethanopterin reductase-like flavin-dependent oxidoreductase (luciferase family)